MKPNPNENSTICPPDECMDNFSENYQLCQLIRDESFGWPVQDPNLDADPFNTASHQALDFDLSVFDPSEQADSVEWSHPWPTKPDSPIPESAWQQLAINLSSPNSKLSNNVPLSSVSLPTTSLHNTSLTPSLAALDFPKAGSLPDELDYSVLGGRQQEDISNCDEFAKPEEYCQQPVEYFQSQNSQGADVQYPQWDYQQGGDLERGSYVVQQPAGPGDVVTIGIYTRAERRAKIQRFRQKRERRNFSKRVLYCSRKRFADSRPRVGGRFVVNENRVIKPKTFLKRGRPRKVPLLPMINCLAASLLLN